MKYILTIALSMGIVSTLSADLKKSKELQGYSQKKSFQSVQATHKKGLFPIVQASPKKIDKKRPKKLGKVDDTRKSLFPIVQASPKK